MKYTLFTLSLLFICPFLMAQSLLKDINKTKVAAEFNWHFGLTPKQVLFSLNLPTTGYEPYITSANETGFTLLKDIQVGAFDSQPLYLYYSPIQQKTYFSVYKGIQASETMTEMWCTDFTEEGTIFLGVTRGFISSSQLPSFIEMNNKVYWLDSKAQLWASDGTKEGTTVIKNLELIPDYAYISDVNLIIWKQKCYLQAINSSYSFGLWETDGTSAGTKRLTFQQQAITQPSSLQGIYVWDNELYVIALENINGLMSLFKVNENANEVEKITEIPLLTGWNSLSSLFPVGATSDALYYVYQKHNGVFTLFKIKHGTNEIIKVAENGAMGSPIIVNNTCIFQNTDSVNGAELWKDTDAGAVLLKDIAIGKKSAFDKQVYFHPKLVGNQAFFFADDSLHGFEMWKTDGTENGTIFLQDILNTPFHKPNFYHFHEATYQNKYYWVVEGQHLCVSDGTIDGTKKVASYHHLPQIIGANEEGVVYVGKEEGRYALYQVNQNHNPKLLFEPPFVRNAGANPVGFT
ncbi:MAG: hypothetical protein ACRCSB_05715, partial [Bacteroidales bacterium]